MYKYVYGPIPSRRLGISLGIDILPRKVCNFNCVYCECGKTMRLITERAEYHPADAVLAEIRDFMAKNPPPDFLSFSGSGEPTLNSGLGRMLRELKKDFPETKIAVFTNSSLMNVRDVRQELLFSDVVLPSLDAASEEAYIKIDRPHPDIKIGDIISGLEEFTREFKESGPRKAIWLEIFIIDGINTDDYNIRKLREAVLRINPDRVQLNTLDRPGVENWVKPAPGEVLEAVKLKLNLKNVEIIKKFKNREEFKAYRKDAEDTIIDTLRRRPSTLEDLSIILSIGEEEVSGYLDILIHNQIVKAEIFNIPGERGVFYKLKPEPDNED
ncbi:MAG: radical SAM protein [Brevinematales bacterium]|jgi:wyosine [tRNA(Phe)-imidazoG37] synthetase (radical SAM superfamily)